MENWKIWLALSGLAMTSCDDSDDSSGNGGDESDADTDTDADADADADTDADTDTDVQGWVADTMQVDASFGYDETTGTIRTMTYEGVELVNVVTATVVNFADYTTSSSPTQFCFVTWTLPEGAISANGDFSSEYWVTFDLTDAVITYNGATQGGPVGDCENMTTFLGQQRGAEDLASFARSWDIGFGIQSLDDVDTAILNEWRTSTWPALYAGDYGAWNQISAGFAAGSLTMFGSAPAAADVMLAYAIDENGAVIYDAKTKTSTLATVAGLEAAPTAYYQSLVMYAFGD